MLVDRNYIFTLYQMGAGDIFRYLQQVGQRIEDAEGRITGSQQAQVEPLSKELASSKRTLARKSQALAVSAKSQADQSVVSMDTLGSSSVRLHIRSDHLIHAREACAPCGSLLAHSRAQVTVRRQVFDIKVLIRDSSVIGVKVSIRKKQFLQHYSPDYMSGVRPKACGTLPF
jgi:hypothetical protein